MDPKSNPNRSITDSDIELEPQDFSDNENPQTWLLCLDGHKDLVCDLSSVFDLTKPAPPEFFNVKSTGEGISSETITLPAESKTLDGSPEAYTAMNKTFEITSPEFKENLSLQTESLSISDIDMLSFVSDISNRMTPLSTSGSNIKRVPNDNKVSLEDSDGSYKMPGYSTPKTLFISPCNKTFELKKDVDSPDHVINTKTFIRPKKNRKSIVQELAHRYCPDKSEDMHKFEVPPRKTVEQASCDQSSQIVSEPKKYHSVAIGMPRSLVKPSLTRNEERNLPKMIEPSFTDENHSKKKLLGRKMASVEDLSKPSMGLRKPAFFSSTLDMRKIGPAIGNAEAGPSSSDSAASKRKGPPVTRSRIPVPSSQRSQQ